MRRTPFALAVTLALGLFGVAEAAAQTGTIRGSVTADGQVLSGAQISLVGTNRGTISNESGRYQLVGVRPGQHTLRVQSIGFQSSEVTVNVQAGQVVTRDFDLTREAVAVQGVTVTVGSRAAHTAADELAVPVDVYDTEELQSTNKMEMAEVLQELAPSVNFPRPQIADITSGVRPFQLRGLSPDHSLVLVNGKRRHPTAVVHVFGAGSMTSGSSGVDINAIAPSAIGRMEVLRDGAAAQYGSDAIAGVINLVLRNEVHAPEFQVSAGKYFPKEWPNDGRRVDVSGSVGFPIFAGGTLNLTAAVQDRQPTYRAGPDPRDQQFEGDADVIEDIDGDGINEVVEKNNPVQQPNHLDGDGHARNYMLFWNGAIPIGRDEEHEVYAFGSYSRRRDIHSGFYRRALDGRNWPQIYPLGFLPTFRAVTEDAMAVGGVRGLAGEWTYDVSGQWGRNILDNTIQNTHNASLGPCLDTPCAPGRDGVLGTADDPGIPNKKAVYAGSLILNQALASLDFTRQFDAGLASPLNLALGAQFRGDNYRIEAGEPASYVNGFHPNQNGGVAAAGSQVFPGYLPKQEVDDWRTNIGVYADVEADLTDMVLVAAAARFERYSDFGNTVTGKLAARLQPTENFILRGALSTGFRAPAQSQTFYSHVSTGFRDDPNNPGNQIAYEIGEFPVGSEEAQALGAAPLKEETSVNMSGGIAWTPATNLNITADVYRITVDDRIILTGTMSGDFVEQLLTGYQATAVKFFTNSINTKTTGVDLTARYRYLLDADKFFEFVGSFNWNEQEVTDIHVPDVITEIQDQVFDEFDKTTLEKARPKNRFLGTARYTHGPLRFTASTNYYGAITVRESVDPDVFYEYDPDMLFDAEAQWHVTDQFSLSVGAENIFDKFPDVRNTFLGIFVYGSSGYGYNGRYLYTKLRATTPW